MERASRMPSSAAPRHSWTRPSPACTGAVKRATITWYCTWEICCANSCATVGREPTDLRRHGVGGVPGVGVVAAALGQGAPSSATSVLGDSLRGMRAADAADDGAHLRRPLEAPGATAAPTHPFAPATT